MRSFGPAGTPRSERWAQGKDEVFRPNLAQLREDIVRANALACETNVLAEELGKQTRFSPNPTFLHESQPQTNRAGEWTGDPCQADRKTQSN